MSEDDKEAEVVREYGPSPDIENIGGVTFDGEKVWFATGKRLQSVELASGELGAALDVPADAGTAFDGAHIFQLAGGVIQKIDRATGAIVATIPSPAGSDTSGLTWAEGSLWIGHFRARKIHQLDPATGKVLRTIDSTRFVTGVTFVDGDLWHATSENDESELRRVAPDTGEVLESLTMPRGMTVSGLESDGGDLFYCGSGRAKTVRAVRRPKRRP